MRIPEKREQKDLGRHWSEWFDGLEITNMWKDGAALPGEIVDQASLHGVLVKARESLGLPLVAVTGFGPVK